MGSQTGTRLSRGWERRELHGAAVAVYTRWCVLVSCDVGRRVGDPRLHQLGLRSDEEQVLSNRGDVSIR